MVRDGFLHARAIAGRLLTAFVLGTATILLMKPDPRMHWATPLIRVARQHATMSEQLRRFGLGVRLHVVGGHRP